MIMRPSPDASPYLCRHWACAIDVVEMVATLGNAPDSADALGNQPWHDEVKFLVNKVLEKGIPLALLQLKGE